MTVYVDDMLKPARVGRIQSRWSHLVADTSDELHAFAARIGMRREWVQDEGSHREHYDLTEPRRAKALQLGAQPITYPHGIAEVIARKRALKEAAELLARAGAIDPTAAAATVSLAFHTFELDGGPSGEAAEYGGTVPLSTEDTRRRR